MATCTWSITTMSVKPVEGSYTDVVVSAGWQCVAAESGYHAFNFGSCVFTTVGDPFTPYADLTQEQVLEWCWANGVNKNEIEAMTNTQLQNQINPPIITPPLPWPSAPTPA